MHPATRNRIGVGLLATAVALLALAVIAALWENNRHPQRADPDNPKQVARGSAVYAQQCAACHGAQLQGQPDWRTRLSNGRLPAPPHDASGHTWHHPDSMLFGITKYGLLPGRYAPPGYQSDMPAFSVTLQDDDIWAVIAYIKSTWPLNIRSIQRELSVKPPSS